MESYGALAGWTHHEMGERIMLGSRAVRSAEAAAAHEPDLFRFLRTRQQAAVLGTYLMRLSGRTPAGPSDRGWFRRLFG